MPGWQQETPNIGLSEYSPKAKLEFMSWSVENFVDRVGQVSVLREHLPMDTLVAICQKAFDEGQQVRFSQDPSTTKNKQSEFNRQLKMLKAYHPYAPLILPMLEIVGSTQPIRTDQTATSYHRNRWDFLLRAEHITAKLFSLLLIEMASYTEIVHAFSPIYKYFFLEDKIPVTTIVRDEDRSKFSAQMLEKIQNACFAMGLRTAALEYLEDPFVASVFQPDRTLPRPLYAWMAVLHATNPPEAKLSEFNRARAFCYSLLANQRYSEFLTTIAKMQTIYPGLISEEYLQKARIK